jgi:hypothetical protein
MPGFNINQEVDNLPSGELLNSVLIIFKLAPVKRALALRIPE